ncbi:MAG: hypothetical protein J0I23_04060 [Rhizobiales bacterium]|nr:hypothetical protein [Hyphomicrobiales bacterium]
MMLTKEKLAFCYTSEKQFCAIPCKSEFVASSSARDQSAFNQQVSAGAAKAPPVAVRTA